MEPEKKERINRKDDTTKSQRRYLATDTEKAKHAYSDVKSSFIELIIDTKLASFSGLIVISYYRLDA